MRRSGIMRRSIMTKHAHYPECLWLAPDAGTSSFARFMGDRGTGGVVRL